MKEIQWFPHHTIEDGRSDRQDGFLVGAKTGASTGAQLDVSSLSDECIPEIDKEEARLAWERGEVYMSGGMEDGDVPSLVVPEAYLTQQAVAEAIRRFKP